MLSPHEALLRLAPLLPEDVLWQSRRWLAAGHWELAGRAVVMSLADHGIDVPLGLREVLASAGGATTPLLSLLRDDESGDTPAWEFVDERARDVLVPVAASAVVTEVLSATPGEHTAWQVWRVGTIEVPGIPPRLVHLVETTATMEGAAELASRLGDALVEIGLVSPAVEVFSPETSLPDYQTLALISGREVFASQPPPVPRLAELDEDRVRLFDPANAVDTGDRDEELGYLAGGHPLVESALPGYDLLDDSAGRVVPGGLLTDGIWVWPAALGYYLDRYGVPIPTELSAHVRAAETRPLVPSRREWLATVALVLDAQQEGVTPAAG
ncbi:hypothetical protein [Actinoalloteichus caeruleus]|uniref:SUKH-4 immunity protein of toxin-antitoxin system n=1 Tax=Actinoalloteichus caeruleus DSM 43889 TaxID=1120930 RepID=A0ABT1JDV6_ACTCY|nr:hypothetical protein [Actinoalloteichus caeruleus]MCP2330684.1 hypothetical protein [Actinoalloteichus caeruleus DSM 43889]